MGGNAFPWFPAYAADWLLSGARRRMNLEQRGAYWDLLFTSWLDESIPADMTQIAQILGITPKRLATIWPPIGAMFVPIDGDPSKLINPRLEEVRAQQRDKSAKQSENGRKGGRPKTHGLADANPNGSQERREEEIKEDQNKGEESEPIPLNTTDHFVSLLPEAHRTSAMKEAVREFFAMQDENEYRKWQYTAMKNNAAEYGSYPVEIVIDALRHSTNNQYQGVFPKDFALGGKNAAKLTVVNGAKSGPLSIAERKAALAAKREAEGLKNAA